MAAGREAGAQSLDDNDQIYLLRTRLNREYDAYLRTYGPINATLDSH